MALVYIDLVAPDGEIQGHVQNMAAVPRKGETLSWQSKTKVVFDPDLDRFVRDVDPDWAGLYVVDSVMHEPHLDSVLLEAHRV